MKDVILYTDGACSVTTGKGGWGAILLYKDAKKELSGYSEPTTNNKMELEAVIQGLKALKEPCKVNVYSDSAYVCNAFLNNWIAMWKKNDWKTSTNKPVMNIESWLELIALTEYHNVTFNKVKGHADNELNNRCDFLATNEIKKHNEGLEVKS